MSKNFNLNRLLRQNVKNLKPYSSARDEFKTVGEPMVFLDANENPFETAVNRYPDPRQTKLKQVLAAQRNVQPGQLLLGNGSDEVLDLLYRAFCEPNIDNVITLPPTYGMYGVLADINAVENREVLLTENFELDVDAILRKQDERSKLLFICAPNNPTGNIFNRDTILELLEKFNGIVVIDEAYIDFSATDSWLKELDKFPNLVVTQTLSKAYGMAGIRLGICYASAAIIEILNKIKPPYNVNVLTQEYALERIQDVVKIKNEISRIKEFKKELFKQLLQYKFIEEIYPSEANFLLIKVDDATKRYQQLLQHTIVVRNRSNQPLCENTLRITVGTEREVETLITALTQLEQ
ncbi:MAG: histidinol-phosphate transaminase [Flavobacteriaceae bacterium]|nr:histidinol-phosphate transaminase [Flavobacteriaceae bacterium]MAY53511.1 histidinol-phosphate transaminase [Flavobacteriaceae bacterium]